MLFCKTKDKFASIFMRALRMSSKALERCLCRVKQSDGQGVQMLCVKKIYAHGGKLKGSKIYYY